MAMTAESKGEEKEEPTDINQPIVKSEISVDDLASVDEGAGTASTNKEQKWPKKKEGNSIGGNLAEILVAGASIRKIKAGLMYIVLLLAIALRQSVAEDKTTQYQDEQRIIREDYDVSIRNKLKKIMIDHSMKGGDALASKNEGRNPLSRIIQETSLPSSLYYLDLDSGVCDSDSLKQPGPDDGIVLYQTAEECCEVEFSGEHEMLMFLCMQSNLGLFSASSPPTTPAPNLLMASNRPSTDVSAQEDTTETVYSKDSTVINIFHCYTSVLPASLAECIDPSNFTDDTCSSGLASVASVMRHSRKRGDGPAIYFPQIDSYTTLVQMHPEGLGLNRLISHDHFGWKAFFNRQSSFFTDERLDSSNLLTRTFSPIGTNFNIQPTSKWADFLHHVHFDDETRASIIYLTSESEPGDTPAVKSLVAALDYVAYLNKNAGCFQENVHDFDQTKAGDLVRQCWLPVVHFEKETEDELRNACLQAALEHPHPPILFYDLANGSHSSPKIVNNKTVVVTVDNNGQKISHLRIEVDLTGVIKNSILGMVDLKPNLSSEFKDDEYIDDLKYLRTLTDQALTNNPVVGTTGFMPLTSPSKIGSSITVAWRMCMGGECPIGNLFTDALRWNSGADFAVLSSGGLRGEGWPAGDVHVNDIWDALPFINYKCTGVMSGVSVYRLLNYTTAVATFESTYTEMGDRLLQMSGMRMTYNTLVDGSGHGRLMSVDVWDTAKQKYLPLERLRLYKFVTDNWMCDHFDPYLSLFGSELQIEGEIPGRVDKGMNNQAIVGAYLTHLDGTYNTSIRGSHINDTEAFEPMVFIQTPDTCLDDYFWEMETLTCKPCPGGKYVKFSEDLISFLITPDTKDLSGRNVLSNRELFNVTLAPKSAPEWVVFQNSSNGQTKGSTVLQPGESIAISFGIDISAIGKGHTRSTISFGVVIDGKYPGCLTDLDITFDVFAEVRSEENLNQLGIIRPIGLTLMALTISLAIFFLAWTFKHRKHRIVKVSQPPFMALICIGTITMALCIIPLSIDDSIASQDACSKACMAIPWLFSMGFAVTFSALFAKIWRIHKVMSNGMRMRRVVVRKRDALPPIAIVFTLNFVLLLCWTLIDPLKWQREYINDDPTNSYGFCESEGKASIAFLILLILLDCSALVLACIQAYRARDIGDEYTESRWLGVACASWIQVLMVGGPVLLLTQNQPVAFYFTCTALVFLVCTSMLLFMFVPKMKSLANPQEAPPSRHAVYKPKDTHSRKASETSHSTEFEVKQYQQRIRDLEKLLEGANVASKGKPSTTIDSKADCYESESKVEEEYELNPAFNENQL